VKAWLSEKGIPFTDRNLAEDPTAEAEFKEKGFSYIPVTVVDGRPYHGAVLATLDEVFAK